MLLTSMILYIKDPVSISSSFQVFVGFSTENINFQKKILQFLQRMGTCGFIAGCVGGILGLVTGHPLDTIKVNQQNQGIGMIECTKDIFRNEGIKGYFRGMAFPVLTASAINSVYFGVHTASLEHMMKLHQETRISGLDPGFIKQEKGAKESHYGYTFTAGCIGGFAQAFLTGPVELVKIKLQTTSSNSKNGLAFRGLRHVLVHIMKTRGVAGLFQGMYITLIRDIPSSGVYMAGYAILSDLLQNVNFLKDSREESTPNGLRILIAGGLAGTCSWWSIIPVDVIKSRIQADDPLNPRYRGWIDCTLQVFRKHGVNGFMRGVLPISIRAFPVNAFTFLGYEWTNTLCRAVAEKHFIT